MDIRILSALDSDLDIRDYRFGLLSPAVILDIALQILASSSNSILLFPITQRRGMANRYNQQK